MAFPLYLIYIFVLMVRPVELLDLDVGGVRPILMMFGLCFGTAIFEWCWHGKVAAQTTAFGLLAGFMAMLSLSLLANGFAGEALLAQAEFGPAAGLFVLTTLNLRSIGRIRATCFVFMSALFCAATLGIYSYHTGELTDQLIIRQRTWEANFKELPSEFKGLPPEHLQNLPYRERKIKEEELRIQEERQDPTIRRAAERNKIIPAQENSGFFLWRMRGVGFFNDPNDLAQAMILVLPFLWILYTQGAFFRNMLFVGAPAAVFVYAIILTNSRGALVGLGALVFFGLREVLGTARTVVATGLVGMLGVVGLVGGSRGFTTGDQSAAERIDLWGSGLDMLRTNPIFGVGYGRFTEHEWLTAHNSFVLAFSELGLPGFFLWVSLLTYAFLGLNRVAREAIAGSKEHRIAIMLRASLAGFLVCGWFLSRTYQATLFLTLALAVTCWYCWQQKVAAEEKKEVVELDWLEPAVMATFGSIAAVYMAIRLERLI